MPFPYARLIVGTLESEDTAMPFPYARLIVGTRHCRVLISANINSDVTGLDMTKVLTLTFDF
jgi:hypothetical protein